ncbi:Dolichyl-phosphate-mannose-protein mannosyltransferase [Pedococcus dokdonensis]|uniref:Dolichyl-phosphate-mannose-protein mannosyltransferase n=1 Tax=Pedococcus dokdonensis TaxID=443156 RepID=A0A1H0R7S9_9MICO|nr:glycosyltransferase family 39 protein [Pedococcus dokdonensis]SDP25541.1 Dolichyl-phosphate-mannose-protein mannosyltransferase [Pedococcus dokdonensis]
MTAPALTDRRTTRTTAASGLPSRVAVLLIGALPVLVVVAAMRPVADPDTFWHIHTGQFLWQSHQFSGPDPWSRFSSLPWVLHEWLPELGLAGLFQLGGFAAVAWAQAVLDTALLVVAYLCARRHANPLVSAITALIAFLGLTGSLAARPQLVTFALTAVVVSVWIRTAEDGRPRWWLVGLGWVWACCHGMWFVGVLVGAATVVALALERRHSPRQLARLAAVPALSLVAAAATPAGPRLLLVPFQISGFTVYVDEWRSPTVHDVFFVAVLVMAVLTAACWALSTRRVPLTLVVLWCAGLGWALVYGRTVAVGAMTLVPVLAASAARLLGEDTPARMPRPERRLVLAGLVLAACVGAAVTPALGSGTGPLVPGGLSPALAQLPARTVVFNEYGTGGWLMLTQPDLDPVVDERTEIYTTQYMTAYTDALMARAGWQDTVERSGATVAVLRKEQPLSSALRADGWQVVGTDGEFAMFSAPRR